MYTEENPPITKKKSRNRNNDVAFQTIFIVFTESVFKEASRNFVLLLFNKPTLKFAPV
jgi:hypothetical protein